MGRVKEVLSDQLERIDEMPFDSLGFSEESHCVVQREVDTKHYMKSRNQSEVIERFLSRLKTT